MPSTTPFDLDDANELRRAIGEIVRIVRTREGLPEGQIETLGFLVRDGAQSIAALARLRRIRHQSMSATVAELEARGWVARSPDPSDARGVLVEVTSAGSAMVAESRVRRSTAILAAVESALTADEQAHLASTPALLDRLAAALRAG